MCYSFRTSMIAYSIGFVSAIVAILSGQIPLGMLILFYCQIQLAEGIIWKGIDENNLGLNAMGTSFAKYVLALQLFGFGWGLYLAYGYTLPLILGILYFLAVCVIYWKDSSSEPVHTFPHGKCVQRECQNNENRLVWPFPLSWYVGMGCLILLFYMVYVKASLTSRLFVVSFFIITYLLAKYVVPPEIATSSLWCFLSAVAAPLVVLINMVL